MSDSWEDLCPWKSGFKFIWGICDTVCSRSVLPLEWMDSDLLLFSYKGEEGVEPSCAQGTVAQRVQHRCKHSQTKEVFPGDTKKNEPGWDKLAWMACALWKHLHCCQCCYCTIARFLKLQYWALKAITWVLFVVSVHPWLQKQAILLFIFYHFLSFLFMRNRRWQVKNILNLK